MRQEMVTIKKSEYEELRKKAKKADVDLELLKDLIKGLEDIKAGRVRRVR